jgi:hypothetical protein
MGYMAYLNFYLKKRNIHMFVFLILLVLGIFFFKNKLSLVGQSTDNKTVSESKMLARKVGKIMFVPKDEDPTIATVTNPENLRGQSFFVDAKVGDKVLIYKNAKKAILYDPIADKIITIAPLILGEQDSTGLNTPVFKY